MVLLSGLCWQFGTYFLSDYILLVSSELVSLFLESNLQHEDFSFEFTLAEVIKLLLIPHREKKERSRIYGQT